MNLLDLFVKISVDDQASKQTETLGQKIGHGLESAAKIGLAAVTAAASGITALTKASIDQYAEYEQLVGGVDTLFGEVGKKVVEDASNAFKDAGLSANEYMDVVTSFSASLLQATGRGAQTNIGQLEYALSEEYEAAEKAYSEQVVALKNRFDLEIAEYKAAADKKIGEIGKENAAEKAAAKEEKTLMVAQLKAAKEEEIAELKESNKEKLKELKKYHEEQIAAAEAANVRSVTTVESQQKAAEIAKQTVIDMADNANKMGSSMESIQNAYQGFAKQNYSMLDNLKLGYGGTASEMYRLLQHAADVDEAFRETANFSMDSKGHLTASFTEIAEAIHIVQEEMGITGTTSLEAGTTISGSASMMKSAWANLVTGMANENANFTELVYNFVDSVGVFAGNLLPRIEIALNGIVMLIQGLAPEIVNALPGLVQTVVPSVINAATSLVGATLDVLPSLVLTIVNVLADALVTNIPQLIPSVVDVVVKLAMMLTDPTTLVNIINASLQIILALADGIVQNLPKLIEAAPVIITNLVTAIVEALPMIVNTAALLVGKIVEGIKNSLPKILDAGTSIITEIIAGAVKAFGKLIETGGNIIINVRSGFSAKLAEAKTWGKDLIDNFINGIKEKWNYLKQTVSSVAQSVKDFLGFSEPKMGPLSNFHTYAPDMMDLFAQGIRDNEHVVTDQIAKSFDFGQRTIDFASSAQGKSSAAMIHGMMISEQSEPKSYVAELYLDGEKVAESTYKPTKKIQKREGEPALA